MFPVDNELQEILENILQAEGNDTRGKPSIHRNEDFRRGRVEKSSFKNFL